MDLHPRRDRLRLPAQVTAFSVTDKSYDDQGRLECTAVRMNPAAFNEAPGACLPTSHTHQCHPPAPRECPASHSVNTACPNGKA